MRVFSKVGDFRSFVSLLEEARVRFSMRILGYCLMHNHWHLVLWPRRPGDLSRFMQWLTTTHVRRWREHRENVGEGHLYQGRFKSFPVQDDPHLLTLLRYAEANPLRARMVDRAERWPWSSLGGGSGIKGARVQLEPWPVERPSDWPRIVNEPIVEREIDRLRQSVKRGQPYGEEQWTKKVAKRLGLESTLRDPWRPRKQQKKQ